VSTTPKVEEEAGPSPAEAALGTRLEEVAVLAAESTAPEPKIGPVEKATQKSRIAAMFDQIKASGTEIIRVPKTNGPQTVIINGARYDVACNIPVEVPKMVADHLRAAGRL
jgi:hypothetical protein